MGADVGAPYSADVWDEVELWSRDRLEDFQLKRLKEQLARVGEKSAHFRSVFADTGFDPRDFRRLEDIGKLPLTDKRDYVAGLAAVPPFGTFSAVDRNEAVRVHFSSGTTGRPTPVLWTLRDIDRWADLYARYMYAQGLRPGDVLQCMFSYSWFVGGLGATLAAQRLGALVVPSGSGDTRRQVETIVEFGTRAVVGTPSFVSHIAETAEQMGVDLASSSVSIVCCGGEPGASVPATRQRIEKLWGARMFDCYGALECQPIGWETALQVGPKVAEDFIHIEVLDAETLAPVEDGQRGVLVLTHLDKQACPMVRWWTGDVVVRDRRPGADGRTHATLAGGVLGRADDMMIVRGVNLFPSAVENVIRSVDAVGSEYQLVIGKGMRDPKTGFLTGVKLRVEVENDSPPQIGERLAKLLKERLQVRFEIDVLPMGTLPRTVHKARRVVEE